MLVSHRYRFIYFKTFKTAGTSVEVALEGFIRPPENGYAATEVTDEFESEDGIVGARRTKTPNSEWYNHMTADQIRNKLPENVWKAYFKFCNIRNPWDKTVSYFHYYYPNIKIENREVIFLTFRKWLLATNKIGQDFHIYSIDGQPVCDDYIRFENLERDLQHICDKLNLPAVVVPRMKSEQRGPRKIPYQEYFDAPTKQKVSEIYEREILLFRWRFKE